MKRKDNKMLSRSTMYNILFTLYEMLLKTKFYRYIYIV